MIKEVSKKDILVLIIITIIYAFGVYVGVTTIDIEKQKQENYIQNLEFKLNVYEQSYDEFALRDAIEQGDSYE